MKHPMIPSSELITEIRTKTNGDVRATNMVREAELIHAAYQAGADAELEACCKWINGGHPYEQTYCKLLRKARRPKLSLKEQALQALKNAEYIDHPKEFTMLTTDQYKIIRQAIESIQDNNESN